MFHDVGKGTYDRSVVNTMLSRGKQKTLLLIPAQAMMLTLSTGYIYIHTHIALEVQTRAIR